MRVRDGRLRERDVRVTLKAGRSAWGQAAELWESMREMASSRDHHGR